MTPTIVDTYHDSLFNTGGGYSPLQYYWDTPGIYVVYAQVETTGEPSESALGFIVNGPLGDDGRLQLGMSDWVEFNVIGSYSFETKMMGPIVLPEDCELDFVYQSDGGGGTSPDVDLQLVRVA